LIEIGHGNGDRASGIKPTESFLNPWEALGRLIPGVESMASGTELKHLFRSVLSIQICGYDFLLDKRQSSSVAANRYGPERRPVGTPGLGIAASFSGQHDFRRAIVVKVADGRGVVVEWNGTRPAAGWTTGSGSKDGAVPPIEQIELIRGGENEIVVAVMVEIRRRQTRCWREGVIADRPDGASVMMAGKEATIICCDDLEVVITIQITDGQRTRIGNENRISAGERNAIRKLIDEKLIAGEKDYCMVSATVQQIGDNRLDPIEERKRGRGRWTDDRCCN